MSIKQVVSKRLPWLYSAAQNIYWGYLIRVHKKMEVDQVERELEKMYEIRMRRPLNIKDPARYTEKIQWCKINAMTALKSRLADKYAVRGWVAQKIGDEHLIPLLGVWDDPEKIDFSRLPNSFVLKTNHASGTNIIVKDKSRLNTTRAVRRLKRWLKREIGWVFSRLNITTFRPKFLQSNTLAIRMALSLAIISFSVWAEKCNLCVLTLIGMAHMQG